MSVLVTGAAGFIGSQVAQALVARGEAVVGVDNFSDQYDPVLKFARLKALWQNRAFTFLEADVDDREAMLGLGRKHGELDRIVHLAAHSGVRQSMADPYVYVQTNVMGHLVLLELARAISARQDGGLKHFVYASASSVYGANAKLPFAVADPVDHPVSVYAATKRADELMTGTYAHLYGLKATGLRYFTTYGPWGRPDMSPSIFAKAIHEGRPIELTHQGLIKRDYSYIDDIVAGTLAVLDQPPAEAGHRIYNLGAAQGEDIVRVIALLEQAFARKAIVELKPGEPGTLRETAADIADTTRDFGWTPRVTVDEGIPKFVEWFKAYNRL
jgi:UDP-glucuronate 4-epimerase